MFLRAVTVLDSLTKLGTSMASPFTIRVPPFALTLVVLPLSVPAFTLFALVLPLALALARTVLFVLGERAYERSPR